MGNPPRILDPHESGFALVLRGDGLLGGPLEAPREFLAPGDDLAGEPGTQNTGEHDGTRQDRHADQPGDDAPLEKLCEILHGLIICDGAVGGYRVCP